MTKLNPSIQHPSANYRVGICLDYCHGFKLLRNAWAHFGGFEQAGKGTVDWQILVSLAQHQKAHGLLLLGNKVTEEVVFFQKRKMSVRLALRAVASESTSKTLLHLNNSKVEGFTSPNVRVTAEFIY